MAGKRVKAKKRNIFASSKTGGGFLSAVKDVLTGGPGKRTGGRLATGLINMHKKKR